VKERVQTHLNPLADAVRALHRTLETAAETTGKVAMMTLQEKPESCSHGDCVRQLDKLVVDLLAVRNSLQTRGKSRIHQVKQEERQQAGDDIDSTFESLASLNSKSEEENSASSPAARAEDKRKAKPVAESETVQHASSGTAGLEMDIYAAAGIPVEGSSTYKSASLPSTHDTPQPEFQPAGQPPPLTAAPSKDEIKIPMKATPPNPKETSPAQPPAPPPPPRSAGGIKQPPRRNRKRVAEPNEGSVQEDARGGAVKEAERLSQDGQRPASRQNTSKKTRN
jgi:hypothetical protein